MAHELLIALSLIGAQPADGNAMPVTPAPPGGPETRYCLRVDPLIGSRIETIQCKTRDEWAALELDVDREWAENGVRVIG
jgi:hypothetical protein